jgi:chemotaxis protein MotB
MPAFKNLLEKLRETRKDTLSDLSLWMLPYSTLMLVLLILFVALYGYSHMRSMEYESALAELGPEAKVYRAKKEVELAKSIRELIRDLQMEAMAEVSITAHTIKLRLRSPVIFESGSAELKPDIMPLLIRLLEHLKEVDNMIIVEGHTDNIPIHTAVYRSNWELSAARAFSVIYFYIKRGIGQERLLAHGYGEQKPSFSNTNEFGRAMNRRIEITILRGGLES